MNNGPDLTAIALPELEALLDGLERQSLRAPVGPTDLQAAGLGHLAPHLAPLAELELDGPALTALLRAVIAERRQHGVASPELVWTGPDTRSGTARDTAVVVRRLFASARSSVIVGGYSFDHGADILRPLHQAIAERGVRTTLFLHLDPERRPAGDLDAQATRAVTRFLDANWPFGPPFPEIAYDPRTLTPGVYASLHAKCVVVDGERAFVGSANFTDRGHSRNVEAGVLLHDPAFARQLAKQWLALLDAGLMRRWVG